MATINGIIANEKSMSGVVNAEGDIINCNTLIADAIETQNIYAIDGTQPCSLFNNNYDTISLGNSATNLMNLGGFQFLVDTIRHITTALNLYLFPTTTGVINFATSASQIVFGSSTALVSAKVPTASNHLANKAYVDSVTSGGLLTSNNTFTGLNTFASTSLTQNMVIDSQTSGESSLLFRTNIASPSQVSSFIEASGGTLTNNGTLSTTAGTYSVNTAQFNIVATSATGASLRINPNTSGTFQMNFRTNSVSLGETSSQIAAYGGTANNNGNLVMTCGTLILNPTNITTTNSEIKYTMAYSNTSDIKYEAFTAQSTLGSPVYGKLSWYKGNGMVQVSTSGPTNIKSTDYSFGTLIMIGYDCPATANIILDVGTSTLLDGQEYCIWNMSASGVGIKNDNLGAITALFGRDLTRGGSATTTLGSNRGCRVKSFTNNVSDIMKPPSNRTAGWIIYYD